MIKKIFRLKEREIKKVLKHRKPFFSYNLIANSSSNSLPYSRFALFLGGKNCKTSISRNFFRRKFYDMAGKYTNSGSVDLVFIPKKGKVFDKNTPQCIVEFEQDLKFIFKKIYN